MTPSEKKAREMEAREILGKGLQSHWRKVKPCGIFGEGVEIVTDYKDVLDELIIALDDAERRGFERAKELVASLILNDGYAITFQTMGQYRTAIAKNIRSLTHDEA